MIEEMLIRIMNDRRQSFGKRSLALAILWFTFPLRAAAKAAFRLLRWLSVDSFFHPRLFVVGLLLPLLCWLAPLGVWFMDRNKDAQAPAGKQDGGA